MPNFNSPEFLKVAIKHGLLSPNADVMDCYMLHGLLLRDETLRVHRLKHGLKVENILAGLTPAELVALRERVTGVVPLAKKA